MSANQVNSLTDRKLDTLWTSPEPSLERQLHLTRLKNFAAARLPVKRICLPDPDDVHSSSSSTSKRSKFLNDELGEEIIVVEDSRSDCEMRYQALSDQLYIEDDEQIDDELESGSLEQRLELFADVIQNVVYDSTKNASDAFSEFFPEYKADYEEEDGDDSAPYNHDFIMRNL